MDVSILICTRNRAEHLQDTLRSIAAAKVPSSLRVELVIVDNGSTDATRTVIEEEAPADLNPRCVYEARPGLSHARNTGIEATDGKIILFTDDDVRVPRHWIPAMVRPIRRGWADAVAGGVRLAEDLRQPWMTDHHASMLADTTAQQMQGKVRLVGANMAIAHYVFDSLPGFDPALGAGSETLGFHEETLVTMQMKKAGWHIETAYDVVVEHRPDPERVQYVSYTQIAEKMGRSDAYLDYHWRHAEGSRLRSGVAWAVWTAHLWMQRGLLKIPRCRENGMDLTEMDLRRRIAYHRQMIHLIGSPRRYDQQTNRKHSLISKATSSEGSEETPPKNVPLVPS